MSSGSVAGFVSLFPTSIWKTRGTPSAPGIVAGMASGMSSCPVAGMTPIGNAVRLS